MSGMSSVNRAAAESIQGADVATIEALTTGLGLIHVLQVYTSAMVAVAVWDWLTCLSVEWKYIWKNKWSPIKGLYIWTRYYGLACFTVNLWLFNGEFTFDQCRSLHFLIAATCMWTTLGSEAILAVRTWAFLGKQRWLGIMLGAMIAGETAFLLYVSIAGVYQISPPPIGDSRGPCTASDKPGKHVVSGFWLAPVAFDLVCTFLTLWKTYNLQTLAVRSPIVKIFVGEGLGYFLAVSSVNILNAAFMFQSNPSLQNINCFLALVLSQVLCCRLVLNLKGSKESHSQCSSTLSSYPNAHSPNVSIPLKSYPQQYSPNDVYDGVKVQIDVEHHDNQFSEDRKVATAV